MCGGSADSGDSMFEETSVTCRMPSLAQHARSLATRLQPSPAHAHPEHRNASARLPTDRDYAAMLEAYRASGGTVRRDALARVLHGCEGAHDQTLGKLLVTHDVFSFEWREVHWVPMFQFDLRDMSIKPRPRRVVAALADVFDGWALAMWFSHPNHWLRNRRPVDVLDSSLTSVLAAARADRFIAEG